MTIEIAIGDSKYPGLLKNIHDPPRRLWVEGDCDFSGLLVAVVGARNCTPYGEKVANDLSRDLVRAGAIIVSGLAYGIDAAAHRGALDGGGRTIAVLGSGIDRPSPAGNVTLAKRIAGQGALVSEFAPGTDAAPWTFPRRNRMISGLCRGVVIVEAGVKSGSLITADLALQQGRDVFAVPGPVNSPQSEGTNRLIQSGAKLVLSAQDILDEWGGDVQIVSPASNPHHEEGGEAGDLLKLLSKGPRHLDELLSISGLEMGTISRLLVDLEIRGKIRSLPGGLFEETDR